MQERNLLYILNISIHLGISENFCQFLLKKKLRKYEIGSR